jgi:thiol-disulfide isomerase/thioredoxin
MRIFYNILKISILTFVLSGWTLLAAAPIKTEIHGVARFAANDTLRLYTYDDLLSRNLVLTAKVPTDAEGRFSVSLPQIRQTTLLTFCYRTTYGSFYVMPGWSYDVDLYTDSVLIGRIDAEMLGNYIQITCLNCDSNELNWKINYFDQYYTYFMYYNGAAIVRHAPKEVYDSLMQIFSARFPVSETAIDFYSVYVRYRKAMIASLYYSKDRAKVYAEYLSSPYVFYDNPAYMDFLMLFFENYLYSGSRQITKGILHQDINELNSYAKLLDDLGKDPLLRNEIIRELVLMKGLSELKAYPEEFKSKNLESLLVALSKNTKFKEHRQMAGNMLKSFHPLEKGCEMPAFCLKDVSGADVPSSRYAGKYLYIQFFTTYCQDCIREMPVLKYLHEQYGSKVEILSVMLDYEPMKLYHFLRDYPDFNWQFAHFGNQSAFLDTYKPYALPLGMLVDPQGKVVAYPAPPASDGLAELFMRMFADIK